MRKLLKTVLLGVLILPFISTGSGARTQQEQIDELRRMIEENQRENQELKMKLEQLQSEKEAEKMKIEELMAKKEEDQETEGLLKFLSSIDLGFYVDTAYEYNFNRPESGTNQFRSLDPEDNEFEIHAAELYFSKTPTMGEDFWDLIGFKIDLLFGEDAPRVAAAGLSDDTVDLLQAYVHILAPVGNGLNIYAGKFTTLAGYEVILAKNDPNITRSFLFGLAEPFTHTGIRASYGAGPLTFTAGVNNGWDNVDDANDGKTIESQIALSFDKAALYVTGIFGPEQEEDDDDWRELISVVGSLTPIEVLTLVVAADFGWEQGVDLGMGEEDVNWWGIAGYAILDPHPAFRFALRAEYFDDPEGFRTGVDQHLFEITPTLTIKPFKGLIADNRYLDNFEFRLEYRFDHSDEDVFEDDDGGFKDTQQTVAAQMLYWIDI